MSGRCPLQNVAVFGAEDGLLGDVDGPSEELVGRANRSIDGLVVDERPAEGLVHSDKAVLVVVLGYDFLAISVRADERSHEVGGEVFVLFGVDEGGAASRTPRFYARVESAESVVHRRLVGVPAFEEALGEAAGVALNHDRYHRRVFGKGSDRFGHVDGAVLVEAPEIEVAQRRGWRFRNVAVTGEVEEDRGITAFWWRGH